MLSGVFLSLCLAAAPQGLAVRLEAPALTAAAKADGEAVTAAVRAELKAEGYEVLGPADQGKPKVSLAIAVSFTKAEGYVVALTLTRESDHLVLDEERATAKGASELPAVATDAAKRIGTEIRLAFGVRVRPKLN